MDDGGIRKHWQGCRSPKYFLNTPRKMTRAPAEGGLCREAQLQVAAADMPESGATSSHSGAAALQALSTGASGRPKQQPLPRPTGLPEPHLPSVLWDSLSNSSHLTSVL